MAEEKIPVLPEETGKKKFALPHIYALLFGIIILCTLMTWILPECSNASTKACATPPT